MTNGENPAYPVPEYTQVSGLTKRELFAAMAMQSVLVLPSVAEREIYPVLKDCVLIADLLIDALNEEAQS